MKNKCLKLICKQCVVNMHQDPESSNVFCKYCYQMETLQRAHAVKRRIENAEKSATYTANKAKRDAPPQKKPTVIQLLTDTSVQHLWKGSTTKDGLNLIEHTPMNGKTYCEMELSALLAVQENPVWNRLPDQDKWLLVSDPKFQELTLDAILHHFGPEQLRIVQDNYDVHNGFLVLKGADITEVKPYESEHDENDSDSNESSQTLSGASGSEMSEEERDDDSADSDKEDGGSASD